MALNVTRKTISGKEAFTFGVPSSNYIVKNFSDADVLVAFDSNATDAASIKIPSMIGQICMNGDYGVDTVYVSGTGEVEVQQI